MHLRAVFAANILIFAAACSDSSDPDFTPSPLPERYVLSSDDSIPEGVAFDPGQRRFYATSLAGGSIVSLDPQGAAARSEGDGVVQQVAHRLADEEGVTVGDQRPVQAALDGEVARLQERRLQLQQLAGHRGDVHRHGRLQRLTLLHLRQVQRPIDHLLQAIGLAADATEVVEEARTRGGQRRDQARRGEDVHAAIVLRADAALWLW